jgi:CO/xanthine dehydrogenase Mo-binding subunit
MGRVINPKIARSQCIGGMVGGIGMALIALCGVAPAIASAVYHATGRRVRDLPIMPEKLLVD